MSTPLRRFLSLILLPLLLTTISPCQAATTPSRDDVVRGHARALEESATHSLDDLVAEFESTRFSDAFLAETTTGERRELLHQVQQAAAAAGGVMLDERNGDIVMRLEGERIYEVVFRVLAALPYAIDALRVDDVTDGDEALTLTPDNVAGTFQQLAADGLRAVVSVRLGGELRLREAYGLVDPARGLPMSLDSAFCIGSTPIDFTVAAILLLDQEGALDLDDPVSRWFPHVPADKAGLTIRHLLEGRSGLPDFFDTPGDWDPDLAWVDRATAEQRILSAPVLFVPGEGRAHSHAAFVLLAALIERASGQDYLTFLSRRIFTPAHMTRTGPYGDALGLTLDDFAVGAGPSFVGLPNIPPNWGPTSWLVMGSGGMVSTLDDLLNFYAFMRGGALLDDQHASHYRGAGVGVGGSDRGYYVFHAYRGDDDEVLLLAAGEGRAEPLRRLSRALEQLVDSAP